MGKKISSEGKDSSDGGKDRKVTENAEDARGKPRRLPKKFNMYLSMRIRVFSKPSTIKSIVRLKTEKSFIILKKKI